MSLLLCLNAKDDGDFGKYWLWSVLTKISEAEYLGLLLPKPCKCKFLCSQC